jgi:septal ring factor EnvC (AmiA/AmiB activator)
MFSKIKKYVIGFFVLCGGLLVAFLSGKGAGRKAEKLGKLDETLKSVKKDLKTRQKKKNGVKKTLKSKKKALEEIKKSKPKPKKKSVKKANSRLKNIGKGKK